MTSSAVLASRFPAMRSFDFRRLFSNAFFTTASRWAQVLARGWLVHELTDGSATAVGWVTFASFAPFIVVGPVVGTLADRFDRRRVLLAATIFGILGAATLAAVTIAGIVAAWHVGVLAFLTGSAQAASVPTRQALIANAVPDEDLLNAVALGGIAQHGSRVVGPLFGAAFLAGYGPGSVFVLSTVLLSIGLIDIVRLRMRRVAAPGDLGALVAENRGSATPPPAVTDAAHPEARSATMGTAVARVRHDLAAAGRYVQADRRLATVIVLVGVHCSFTMAFDAMMPTLAEVVGGSSTLYSAILVGLGTGALIGTLGVSQLRGDQLRGVAFAVVGIGSGVAMVVLGTAATPQLVVLGAALAGLTQASYMTMSATYVQKVVDDDYRGRVMSLYIMIAAGHMAMLNLGFGRLADSVDVRLLLVIPGVLWMVVFAFAGLFVTEARAIVRTGRFTAMQIGPGARLAPESAL